MLWGGYLPLFFFSFTLLKNACLFLALFTPVSSQPFGRMSTWSPGPISASPGSLWNPLFLSGFGSSTLVHVLVLSHLNSSKQLLHQASFALLPDVTSETRSGHSSIRNPSFWNTYWVSVFCVPGAEGTAMNKWHPCPYEAYILETDSKQMNEYMVCQVVITSVRRTKLGVKGKEMHVLGVIFLFIWLPEAVRFGERTELC